jgi:glycosyltransferase involved in cell wall biosynthesis
MKLSILVPSVMTRRNTFLPRILEQLNSQYEALSEREQRQVEIIVLMDNKKIMLGDKRNLMVDQAQGEYVVFVDDDDRIADDYIKSLLRATQDASDVITFKAEVTINGGEPKICIYSKEFEKDHNTDTYNRLPNHICCVKKSLASRVLFPSVLYGEDSGYAKLLKPLLRSQTMIDKILYYYDYNAETTETQAYQKNNRVYKNERTFVPSIVDVIILSNAKDDYFKGLTQQTIDTALETSKGYKLNIIVMEQNKEVVYKGIETVHYDYEFNYNKVANDGASRGTAPYVMIANNDLIFKENWLFELLMAEHNVVSPKCPVDNRQKEFIENTKGYEVAKHFSGWCFMVKRHIWEEIEGFDEDFGFWFADNATVRQLEEKGYIPMIVPKALVEHLGSQTLNSLDSKTKKNITVAQAKKYNEKYDEHHFE